MSRSVKVVLILAAGFAFAVLVTSLGPSALGVVVVPGFVITVAIFVSLRIHPSAHPLLLGCLSIVFNTVIYGVLIGLVLIVRRFFRSKRELLAGNEKDN